MLLSMRRLIIFIMVILISTGTVLATGEEISFSNMQEEQEEYILGDVNSNGAIDLHDAIMILQYNVGLIQIDDLQKADVNLDGNIDVKDAILVLKYIVGLIEDFTYLSLPQGSFFVNGGSGGYNLDDKGVPIHDNGSYHPTQIAQYGLDLYADYLNTGSAGYKKKLKPVAEWLLENAEHSSQFSYWTFDFDYSPFNQVAPWNLSLIHIWTKALITARYSWLGLTSEDFDKTAQEVIEQLKGTCYAYTQESVLNNINAIKKELS